MTTAVEEPGTDRVVVLDTDIGSDVDDAQALAVLLGDPRTTLAGCTTVYGDTLLRARLAARLCRLSGRPVPPMVPGSRDTLTNREVWWAGHEGSTFDDLDTEEVNEDMQFAEFISRTAAVAPGRLDLVAIGPLTNVATALAADASLAGNLRHLYIMGGRFDDRAAELPAEHNFKCDPEATAAVFTSGVPITVTGLEITGQVRIDESDLAAFADRGPLGKALAGEIRRWWEFIGARSNTPHDGLAVLSMLAPELFGFEEQRVRIDDEGRSLVDTSAGAVVRVTTAVDADAARQAIVERIAAAQV